ncbi:unnamed protein product [Rotaria magnacalcarata]|uniref:NAD(P)(+)--arginine ADP-ribosyltransferase n=2 Tax=Rotaria magnacalcarata TaxID=392030 RepID=A0A815QWI9_9BILA|nr:unnamed protein product [Rotaria magnacalcarata]CAF1467895.1 unnamed protein product [Rotaria magnacalcarata]
MGNKSRFFYLIQKCVYIDWFLSLVKKSQNSVHVEQSGFEDHDTTKCFDIVWLDERPRETLLKDQHYFELMLCLEEYNLHLFQDFFECEEYLRNLPITAKIILLVRDEWAEDFVLRIFCICYIKFILVIHPIGSGVNDQNALSVQYGKVKHVTVEQVADRIHYCEDRFLRSNKDFFSIDIFNPSSTLQMSSTRIDGRFLFTQLLLDILLRMESKYSDKDELIALCTKYYANDSVYVKRLKKFSIDYNTKKVFEWYSKDTFVYRQLNGALRSQNIDLIFLFRFILQDLQSQLSLHQEQSPVRVYRGQKLSKDEWKDLSNATGQYISMSSMLSTSLKRNVAKHYLDDGANEEESDEVQVLFEIEADPHRYDSIKPFANITHFSQFPEECEVLFMVGSIFRVTEITNDKQLPIVKMELRSDDDNDLKAIFDILRSEYGEQEMEKSNHASMNSFGTVLLNMSRFNMADKFFRRIYHETPIDDPKRANYCKNIGDVALNIGHYEKSAQWYMQALKIHEKDGTVDQLSAAKLHLSMGSFYRYTKQRRRALDSYNKALTIYRNNFGENNSKAAMCYHNIASQFERRKYYSQSIEYLQKALDIAENVLPESHPNLITYHLLLATLLINLRHRELERALNHAQAALHIAQKVFPPDHQKRIDIYALLGEIYKVMGDVEQKSIWFNKVDELYSWIPDNDRIKSKGRWRTNFICRRCHRSMWIYRSFAWMKGTRLNCVIFHDFGSVIENLARVCFHY